MESRSWNHKEGRFNYHLWSENDELGVVAFGKTFYEGDIVVGEFGYINSGLGIVKFGKYEQAGSEGEYSPSTVSGFYVERIRIFIPDWQDPDDIFEESYSETVSIFDSEFKKVGNIHENPEIIKEYK